MPSLQAVTWEWERGVGAAVPAVPQSLCWGGQGQGGDAGSATTSTRAAPAEGQPNAPIN